MSQLCSVCAIGREIRDHVRKDLQLGLAPYRSLDRFDVVADAFDIVRVGVHFCSDHLGHGGQNCEQVHGDFLDTWTNSRSSNVFTRDGLKKKG